MKRPLFQLRLLVIFALAIACSVCQPAYAQNFPASLDTTTSFPRFEDFKSTYLTGSLSAVATTITVADISGWSGEPYIIQIDSELMIATKTSSTSLLLTRGVAGTTAASHLSLSTVKAAWSSLSFAPVRLAVLALEVKLGTGTTTPLTSGNILCVTGAGITAWETPAACGISGGGGGGSVATDSIFTAKGDLAAGTGASTAAALTIGGNDNFLIVDTTQTTGLKWANAARARTALALGTLATQSGTFSGTSSGTNTGDQTSVSGNAGTATALAANPADCAANQYATTIAANGDLTCAQVSSGQVTGLGTSATHATGDFLQTANNLSDVTAATARTNLGLGSIATQSSSSVAISGGTVQVNNAGLSQVDVGGLNKLVIKANETLTGTRTLNLITNDADRTLTIAGTASISGTSSGTNTGDQTTVSGNAGTATALAADPADCATNRFANAINASGTLTCAQVDLTTSAVTGILTAANGGNGNGFFAVSGPATSTKTFTFPNVSETIATLGQAQTFTAANTFNNSSGIKIKDTDASNTFGIVGGSNLTADRTLTLTTGDASRVLTFTGDATISGTNTGDQTLASLGAAASGANTDITSVLLNQTGLVVKGATSNALTIKPNETLTGARTLNLVTGDATRTLTFTGDATVSGTTSGTNTGDQTITLTGDVTGSGTGSFAATIGASKVTNSMLAGSIDLTTKVTGILPAANGGTANGFTAFTGPATSTKTFTLPNATATILTDNAAVTGAQGGTGVSNSGKTITLGGNLTTSGAFATTLTATNTTTVTLPTTGTLATTTQLWGGPNCTSFSVSGSDATTTGTTLADITGLVTGTLSISSNYTFSAMLYVTTTAVTTGTEYGTNVTVAPTRIAASYVGPTTVASNIQAMQTTGTNANNIATPAFLTTASEEGVVMINGFFTTAGSGSPVFSLRHLKVTSGTSTVMIGSWVVVCKQ